MVFGILSSNGLMQLSSCPTSGSRPVEIRAFVSLGSQKIDSSLKLTLSVSALYRSTLRRIHCIKPDEDDLNMDAGGSSGGENGGGSDSGGGGGGGDDEELEFGPLMMFEEVMKEAEAKGVAFLPSDMMEASKSSGIRSLFLTRFIELQAAAAWPLCFLIKYCSMIRNRALADPLFLYKLKLELLLDSCSATIAEVKNRGKDFWSEFELYLADLLVGLVVDIAVVSITAPYARFGQPSASKSLFGHMQRACAALPSSVFEAQRPGCRFSVKQRIASYFYTGVLFGSVGFTCGLMGQGIANLIMTAKRNIKKSEDDIPVPPLVQSAALWGVFLALSSNTRYHIVNGLDRLIEATPIAKKSPSAAKAFTTGVRVANNIYGGMQFVNWAKLSGVQ